MQASIFVLITSGETCEGAWRSGERALKALKQYSRRACVLTEDPEQADLILIANVRERDWGRSSLEHPLLNRFPDKCFSLSDRDQPLILNRGIYASGVKSLLGMGRVRSGAYTLQPDAHLNPFIRSHQYVDPGVTGKRFLLSFIGRRSHSTRDEIFGLAFARRDVYLEDSTRSFDLWGEMPPEHRRAAQQRYCDVLLQSKFVVCPRGYGVGSMRLFEAMQLGVAPIIASDNWVFPRGPDWRTCSIVIKERHVRDVETIAVAHEPQFAEIGRRARAAYEAFFADDVYFDYVVSNCLEMRARQIISERAFWRLRHHIVGALRARSAARGLAHRLRAAVIGRSRAR